MYNHKDTDTPTPLMCVRREHSAHLPSPRRHSNDCLPGNELPTTRRRHSNDRLQGNELPTTRHHHGNNHHQGNELPTTCRPLPTMCRSHSNDCLQGNELPTTRHHHGNDHQQGNELPTTTNLDDMIDALDHDISRNIVHRASSGDTTSTDSRNSPLSLQLLS